MYLRESAHCIVPCFVELLHLLVGHLLLVSVSHLVRFVRVWVLEDPLHVQLDVALLTRHLDILNE